MSRLLLIRHGETELQSSLRYWGKTDVALGAVGLRQAEQLRDRLAAEKIDFVYSSELKRAADTARVIAAGHSLPVITCPELREIDFGKLEGLEFAEIQSRFPKVAQMWINRSPSLVYPDGESMLEFEHRVAKFDARLKNRRADETILIVAHTGVLRTIICRLLEFETKNRWNIRLDLTSLSIIETYPGINILCLLNDVSHLRDKPNC